MSCATGVGPTQEPRNSRTKPSKHRDKETHRTLGERGKRGRKYPGMIRATEEAIVGGTRPTISDLQKTSPLADVPVIGRDVLGCPITAIHRCVSGLFAPDDP